MIMIAAYISPPFLEVYHFNLGGEINDKVTVKYSDLNRMLRTYRMFHGEVAMIPVPNKDANLYVAPPEDNWIGRGKELWGKIEQWRDQREQEEEVSNEQAQRSMF